KQPSGRPRSRACGSQGLDRRERASRERFAQKQPRARESKAGRFQSTWAACEIDWRIRKTSPQGGKRGLGTACGCCSYTRSSSWCVLSLLTLPVFSVDAGAEGGIQHFLAATGLFSATRG